MCSVMIVYFEIITALPFSTFSDNGCEHYYFVEHRSQYHHKQFPDAFYANTVMCLVGWVSYISIILISCEFHIQLAVHSSVVYDYIYIELAIYIAM